MDDMLKKIFAILLIVLAILIITGLLTGWFSDLKETIVATANTSNTIDSMTGESTVQGISLPEKGSIQILKNNFKITHLQGDIL